jgi:N-acetylglucosaminyldiphosphoundecaprenol N-acetyl-beta-D-mannosaminyltransferase
VTISAAETRAVTVEVHGEKTFLAGKELFQGSEADLLDELAHLLSTNEVHLVVTPNVDQVVSLRTSEEARAAVDGATLRLIDGAPLLFLAKRLGGRQLCRLTGADLIHTVSRASAGHGWRIALAGGDSAVSTRAAATLRSEYPGADVISVPFPYLDTAQSVEGNEVVSLLREVEADIVFLCLGFPKQESWFLHWREVLPSGVYIGAGAAVDFAAGDRQRAPKFAQKIGAEWLWRLAQEPRRLAYRYLVKGPTFLRVIADSYAARRVDG